MDERLDLLRTISTEQKRLAEEQSKMGITLHRLTDQVAYHIKRSDTLEDAFSVLQAEFQPVKTHVTVVNLLAKIAVGSAAFIYALTKIARFF